MLNPAFLNKNWYRNYPLRSGCSLIDVNGRQLPVAFISGLSISRRFTEAGTHTYYLKKSTVMNGRISIEIADADGTVGWVNGVVDRDNQAFNLQSDDPSVSGVVVTGSKETVLQMSSYYTFDSESALIEPSCIKCYPTPLAVLSSGNQPVTGHIDLVSDNTTIEKSGNRLKLDVVSVDSIKSRQDLSSERLTCLNNIIIDINGVRPDPKTGEITIFAIAPLKIETTPYGLKVTTDDFVPNDLCKPQNLPVLSTSNDYKGYLAPEDPERNVLTTDKPEYKDWDERFD